MTGKIFLERFYGKIMMENVLLLSFTSQFTKVYSLKFKKIYFLKKASNQIKRMSLY